ncbi:hypothetical protein [Lysobacter capsici]|uniref:hypothetical protein n=1 Tax=Lysobacter capsici TaxID=435897 RepID=UPI000716766C|nr:hypothetical protein [Lysobacter capsici]
MNENEKEVFAEICRNLLDKQSALQAHVDVLSIVVGHLITQLPTEAVIPLQAALEVAEEQAIGKSEAYSARFEEQSAMCRGVLDRVLQARGINR